MEAPRVSVVVIGRNEGERLSRCFASIFAMQYPRELLDIVYVDSDSADGSVARANDLGIEVVCLRGFTTAACGRNAGWRQGSAPFVLFLDGDTIVEPSFLREALQGFDDPKIAGVFGDRRELDTSGSLYNAVSDLNWLAAPGPVLYFGGDAVVLREALERVGGFTDDLVAGEEPDMCRRMRALGYKVLHMPIPMTLHDLDIHRFGQYWRRSVRTGYAYAEVSSLYAQTEDPLWLDASRRNVSRGLFWIGAPLASVCFSLLLRSAAPMACFIFVTAAFVGRTAWNAGGRTPKLGLRLAYGVHSHFEQIPILLGQLLFWRKRQQGLTGTLIEYK